ncbi:MAG: hypothetical protein J7J61_04355 [Candidatus Hydrothermae bacterium]|nr:hypothetical protein [Candidatus Hydrothermae bacterium]
MKIEETCPICGEHLVQLFNLKICPKCKAVRGWTKYCTAYKKCPRKYPEDKRTPECIHYRNGVCELGLYTVTELYGQKLTRIDKDLAQLVRRLHGIETGGQYEDKT